MDNERAILNLTERFRAIESSSDLEDKHYISAVLEYADLLGSSDDLSKIVRELAIKGEIDKNTLQSLFNYSILRRGFRNTSQHKKDIGIPKFYNKDLERNFSLFRNFQKLLTTEYKRFKKSKKDNIKLEEVFLPEDKKPVFRTSNEKELFEFRIMNNKIIAVLSNIDETKKTIDFNKDKAILTISNSSISMKKYGDEYSILLIILNNKKQRNKEWFFSDIAEEYDASANIPDKKFYNATYQINKKLEAVGIMDFFITTRQSVKINKEYLS